MAASTEQPRRFPVWPFVLVGLVLVFVALGVVGGMEYRNLMPNLEESSTPSPPPPSEKIPDAPGPDNTVKSLPPSAKDPDAPGPDNTVTTPPRE